MDGLLTNLLFFPQFKSGLEKTKQVLESERNELSIEIKSLMQSKAESEHRRKKLESIMQEMQVKYTDGDRSRSELIERVGKLQVKTQTRRCS